MALSGKKTVTTAGTAVRLTSQPGEIFLVKALIANTGKIYLGNDGSDDVSSANGYELNAGEYVTLFTKNLDQYWIDSDVNGEGVSWLCIA